MRASARLAKAACCQGQGVRGAGPASQAAQIHNVLQQVSTSHGAVSATQTHCALTHEIANEGKEEKLELQLWQDSVSTGPQRHLAGRLNPW